MTRPVALIILDGFGLAPAGPGNAVALADTPVFDDIWAHRPRTSLKASGEAVGLPAGQMGNSEVGHMNIGAGRVVRQSLTHLRALIEDGSFYRSAVLLDAYRAVGSVAQRGEQARASSGATAGGARPRGAASTGATTGGHGGTLHLLGLVSDGGVHSDLGHLLALLELAGRERVGRLRLHAFSDGRDSPPDGAAGYLATVERAMGELRASGTDARIATVTGRYYAMDRDKRWERTRAAYEAVVCGTAPHVAASAVEAVAAAYDRGESDEFIQPTVVIEPGAAARSARIVDGDAVVFFNFRADRARQLSHALLDGPAFMGFERCATPRVEFASLMQYDEELGAKYSFALPELDKGLAEVVASAGLRQYHTAETEKYAHVTYFFNLQREEPFALEERLLVPSPKVATYDLQPAMSAAPLTAATVERLTDHADDFVLINYANPDMVGHTGVIAAAVEACEAVDSGLGRLLAAVLAKRGAALVIADHGNAEQMLTAAGEPHTAHTTNEVPCVLVSDDPALRGVRLRAGRALADVAPTVLDLLGLERPVEMTGESLLLR